MILPVIINDTRPRELGVVPRSAKAALRCRSRRLRLTALTPHRAYASRPYHLKALTPHGAYASQLLRLTVLTPHGAYVSASGTAANK